MYKCAECNEYSSAFDSTEQLKTHIALKHVDLLPYRCELCSYASIPTKAALRTHFRDTHALTEFYVS